MCLSCAYINNDFNIVRKLRKTQSKKEISMPGIILYDRVRNEEMRRRIHVEDIIDSII